MIFWIITERVVVIHYRRFETIGLIFKGWLEPPKLDQQFVPKRPHGIITTTRYVITKKSAVLVYSAAEA